MSDTIILYATVAWIPVSFGVIVAIIERGRRRSQLWEQRIKRLRGDWRYEEAEHRAAKAELRVTRNALAVERSRVDHALGIDPGSSPRTAARKARPFTDFGHEPAGVRAVDEARRHVEART